MNSVDRVKAICKERKIAISKLERELGYANGYIGQLRKGTFPADRLAEIAAYLSVAPEFLITGEEEQKNNTPDQLVLTEGEEKLIQLFRQVPQDRQAMVLQMIEAALKTL